MTIPNQPVSPGFPDSPAPRSTTDTEPSAQETSTSGAAKEQAQQTAETAADEGKHVAGVAVGEAKQVAGEAVQQAQNLLEEARTQVDGQARTQRDRLVKTLQEFSGQLDGMADGEGAPSGLAQDAVRQAADRARDLTSRLDGREPSDLLAEVRTFARRKPGTFLLGAMAAGLVAGRLTRGSQAAASPEASDAGPSPVVPGVPVVPVVPVDPLSGARTTEAGSESGRISEPLDPLPTTGTGTGPDVTSTRTPL